MTDTYLKILPSYFPPESPQSSSTEKLNKVGLDEKKREDSLPRSSGRKRGLVDPESKAEERVGETDKERVERMRSEIEAHGGEGKEAEMDCRPVS